MNIPNLNHPQRYRGLYVYQAADWTATGYTAEEIAMLLESDEHRGGTVYKIQRAYPDGRMELRGVSPERFQLESGMFFYRSDPEAAQADLQDLRALAARTPPPCRAFLHLTRREAPATNGEFVVALVFPAEYEEEIGQWLLEVGFRGGDRVEGGISHVSNYYSEANETIERVQLWSRPANVSRTAEEVFASVRRAVQR